MSFKLLIIRFSSIGDIVLTSPVVRCIHEQRPDIAIHYLTKKRYAEIVLSNPYINKVYYFENELNEVIPALKSENYDLILDLHKNIRSNYIIASLKKPFRSFNKLNLEKWLMVRLKINILPNKHIVGRYLEPASVLNIENDSKGLDFFIPSENEISIEKEYPALSQGYVAFVIGGNHNTKIFPADLASNVINNVKFPIVLLGGRDDYERGTIIETMTAGRAINLCGKLSLMQSASLVRQASVIISNDTGLMHIAAAFNKPIVSVWGNTVPEFGMYPYLKNGTPSLIAEVKNLSCRPCSKLGFKKCPLKHFNCMRQQNINEITSFVNNILDEATSVN